MTLKSVKLYLSLNAMQNNTDFMCTYSSLMWSFFMLSLSDRAFCCFEVLYSASGFVSIHFVLYFPLFLCHSFITLTHTQPWLGLPNSQWIFFKIVPQFGPSGTHLSVLPFPSCKHVLDFLCSQWQGWNQWLNVFEVPLLSLVMLLQKYWRTCITSQ